MPEFKINYFIFIIILFSLFSCGKSDQEIKNEKEKVIEMKRNDLTILNDNAINDLSVKYGAFIGWDTIDAYTSWYQTRFVEEKRPMCFEGKIIDVVKKDSTYLLELHNTKYLHRKDFLATVTLSEELVSKFDSLKELNTSVSKGGFILKIDKIYSNYAGVRAEGSEDDSYLEFNFNNKLVILKGQLLDFCLNEPFYNEE